MMEDQVAWIRDRDHRRVVTEVNGRDSLAIGLRGRRAGPPGGGRPMTVRRLSTRLLLAARGRARVPRRLRGRRRLQPRGGPGGGRGRAPGPGGRAAPGAAAGVHRPAAVGPDRRPDDRLGRPTRSWSRSIRGWSGARPTGWSGSPSPRTCRVVRCGDGRAVREITSVTFRPRAEVEEFGVEDPRITPLDGRFYFTYVAVSRHGPATALASHDRLPHVRAARGHLLPREQGRGPVPGADRRCLRRAAPAGLRDAVHPAGDVGRAVAGPDPLGGARPAGRLGRRLAIGPGRGRAAADPRPGRLAGDLSREPPADPAGRGRHVLRRGPPARPGRPGPGPPADARAVLRAPRPTSRSPASCRTSSSRPGWCRTGRRSSSTTGPPTRSRRSPSSRERELLGAMTAPG